MNETKCANCSQPSKYEYKDTGLELCSDCVSEKAQKEKNYYATK